MTGRKARELAGKTLVFAKPAEGRGVSLFDDTTRVSETAELGFFCTSEQLPSKQQAPGSNPGRGTLRSLRFGDSSGQDSGLLRRFLETGGSGYERAP